MDRMEANAQDGLRLVADTVGAGNYLGSPTVVDHLLRDFMAGALSILAEFEDGRAGDEGAAEARVHELAKRYEAIFLGEDEGYVPMPWNSRRRLAIYLRAICPKVDGMERSALAFFVAIASTVIANAIAVNKGLMVEADAKADMIIILNDATKALLGTREGASRPK